MLEQKKFIHLSKDEVSLINHIINVYIESFPHLSKCDRVHNIHLLFKNLLNNWEVKHD